ncbi:uncharacterized protein F5147DRAFT_646941 [Suillus discolor]|uniref:Uncharacterized protein n=1 Tax=Suillus discolor TaxID=1912936 RepID=A0A9P7FKV9_9AGAM|nr:uncharacterized protein F5147DRAFT_646941 [Suillus discolor]KAG2120432.1 hypothetical protein F5147DRAFT_646941 [Suillus discolor]
MLTGATLLYNHHKTICKKRKGKLVMHVTSDGSLETVADSRMESIVIRKAFHVVGIADFLTQSPERRTDGVSAHPIQGQTWRLASFAWDDDDESLDEAPEFGEHHDFDDPGSARWESLETRGLPGNGSPYEGGGGSSSHS